MLDLSQETEALAQRLAGACGVSIDTAARQALEAQAKAAGLAPEPRPLPDPTAARRAAIDRAVRAIAAMPILDSRSPCEIMDDINDP